MDSRYIQQFKKGSLEMILLCLIAKRETYGYEIILELNNNGASVLGYEKKEQFTPFFIDYSKPNSLSVELHLQRQMVVQRNIILLQERDGKPWKNY